MKRLAKDAGLPLGETFRDGMSGQHSRRSNPAGGYSRNVAPCRPATPMEIAVTGRAANGPAPR